MKKIDYNNLCDKIIIIIKKHIENNSDYDESAEIGTIDCSDVDNIAEGSATEIIELLRENGVKAD